MFPVGLMYFFLSTPQPLHPDLVKGDELFLNRHVEANARQAFALYRETHEKYPGYPDAGWRVGMASQFLGQRLTPTNEEKEVLYRDGRDAALLAAERDPKCAPCHFWAGICMALYGETVGALKMLFSLDSIEEHLKTSAEIDPAYAHAGAYRVLGLIAQRLPGLLGGSNRRAREYFEKALEAEPGNALNFFMLARFFADSIDEPGEANAVVEKALSYPRPPITDIESHEAWEEIKKYKTAAPL